MKRILYKSKTTSFFFLIGIILTACAGGKQITSEIPTAPIVIDGQSTEWREKLRYIENEKCAVGIQNDKDYIYICLETSDMAKVMKILTMGLTTWLAPEEGKTLGILYPQKRPPDNIQPRQPRMQTNRGAEALGRRINNLLTTQTNLQIINEDEFPLYAYPINDPLGFQVSLGFSMGKFVYELRVPYGENRLSPIILDAFSGENLGISFETGELDMTAMGQRTDGRNPGSGMRGRGGGMGGIRPGRRAGMAELSEQFELTLEIILAK
ncbi:hypothetical protein ACFLTH_08255 [Bacteroidota bacterium]